LDGDSREHASLTVNLIGQVGQQTRRTDNHTFAGGLRIRCDAQNYLYADLTVVCGKSQIEKIDEMESLLNPGVIFEILSEKTEQRDRGVKWHIYQQIKSLQHYVLISRWDPYVEIYTRKDNGDWLLHIETDPAGSFAIPAIDVTIGMADLYEGVPIEVQPNGSLDEASPEEETPEK